MNRNMFLCVIALVLSTISLISSFFLNHNRFQGPFFIESNKVLEADAEMQIINKKIAMQDALFKKEEQVFNDSIAKLLDTLAVRRGDEEKLIDLMNLESNIFRHKKIDSIATATRIEVDKALNAFNERIKLFSQKKGISVLFGTNDNSIVYGSGSKANLTNELIKFIGNQHE